MWTNIRTIITFGTGTIILTRRSNIAMDRENEQAIE
jgi:hypothetical protein